MSLAGERCATLITGLVMQRVIMGRNASAHYYTVPELGPLIASDGEILALTEPMKITERVVPITKVCSRGKSDLYIAYSEEVEELLGVPVRVILKEKDAAYAELNRLRSMSAWEHIKTAYRLCIARVRS